EGAFYSCERLIAVSIPNSVKTIGPSAFSLCYKLSSVHYAGTEEQWSEIDIHYYGNGCLEDADRKYNSILVVGEVMVG
ncbi:MAG: leucine-rich repeat protein, partial [Clostridia bacterium]|nr:leucine-rich repeat protein [Clostridia bacterium]